MDFLYSLRKWITRETNVSLLKEDWCVGYLDHHLERITEKVPVCNQMKKLLILPGELGNLMNQQMVDLATCEFAIIVFRMAEKILRKKTKRQEKQIGTRE